MSRVIDLLKNVPLSYPRLPHCAAALKALFCLGQYAHDKRRIAEDALIAFDKAPRLFHLHPASVTAK
jgi:hypothetical protein